MAKVEAAVQAFYKIPRDALRFLKLVACDNGKIGAYVKLMFES